MQGSYRSDRHDGNSLEDRWLKLSSIASVAVRFLGSRLQGGPKRVQEMVSVGRDGQLWIMTGPLGGDYRLTEEFKTADGDSQQLRFTRFNVTPNAFESRMEYTSDGGRTWKPGNHQRFQRVTK
jgi:hypothetical protein